MLPGGAMSELIGRIGALQLITKDQIMNLAVELLPPARVRELMSHLGVLVGFQEWDQIRHRRRRAIGDLIMAYLTTFIGWTSTAWKGRLTWSPMPAVICLFH